MGFVESIFLHFVDIQCISLYRVRRSVCKVQVVMRNRIYYLVPPQPAQSRHARNASKLFCHGCALSPSPRPIRTTLHCDFEDPSPLLLSGAGSESRISNTSRTAWMIFDDPFTKTRMPLRRWISNSVGQGSEADSAKGRVESQSTERSQASTLGILSTERGGVVMGMVDIA